MIKINYHMTTEVEAWLEEHCGPGRHVWSLMDSPVAKKNWENQVWAAELTTSYLGYETLYFKEEKDYVLFALRWL
jgi:hypothetical protein